MANQYKIHEFAELAGVTVKALIHYDRLGLLKPKRTGSRYRIYDDRDLERLEQIVALKFLEMPLKQIKAVLDCGPTELKDALKLQREALAEKQRLLARALSAITEAEEQIQPDKPTDTAVLKALIQNIGLQGQLDVRKYFSDAAQVKFKRLYKFMKSSEEYKSLQQGVVSALGDDPAGDKGKVLAARFQELMKRDDSLFADIFEDPEVLAGLKSAGADIKNWPPAITRKLEASNVRKSHEFLTRAMASLPKEG